MCAVKNCTSCISRVWLKKEGRQILDCSWNPTNVLADDGDLPIILQDQSGPRSQNPPVHALSLCTLPTDHPFSPPTYFPLSGPINSGGMCFHTWSARAIGPHRDDVAGSPNRAWESLGQVVPWGKHRRGALRSHKPFRRGTDPYSLFFKLNTPDRVFFQEEQSVGRKRDKSKEVVSDSTQRTKFPLCTMVLPQLTSVKHYFKIGFSFAWKVFFFLPLHFPELYKTELLLVSFFLLFVSLFICSKLP